MSKYHTFGGATYSLGASIGSSDTSIILTSFKEPVSGVPYTFALLDTDIVYATIAPGTSSSEFISFTSLVQNGDGTCTLGGVVRGLAKKTPFTTSATFKLPHSSQTTFIISNSPQLYEKFAVKSSDEIISGQWTFQNTPISPAGGVSDASISIKGVSTLSIAPVSPTAPIAVGDNDPRLVTATIAAAVATGVGNLLFPVGSIYTNAAVATNPATLLGFGTWTAFGTGQVLVGVDTGQTEFDTLGETGGAKTHQLTIAELPSHNHSGTVIGGSSSGGIYSGSQSQVGTGYTGSDTAHNNLQPYITVYMWKRTA